MRTSQNEGLRLLANSRSRKEFEAALDLIKLDYDGKLPPWYATAVTLSGLEREKLNQFSAAERDNG